MTNSKKNIAFLCHPYHRGGVTSWMINSAYECAKQGFNTYFITVKPKSAFISSGGRATMLELLASEHPNLHLIYQTVSFEFELGTEEYKSHIYKRLIEKSLPADCPIIISDDSAVWVSAALVSNQYPMIGVIHSSMDDGYYQLSAKYHQYLSKVICVSGRTRKNLFDRVPNTAFDTAVIPCGIPTGLYQGPRSTDSNQLNIIWTGRLDEKPKRVSDIPKIANLLKSKGVVFNIQVIGQGDAGKALEKAIAENGLENEITLLGWQESSFLIEAYKKSGLLLQTSNYEGMSVSVMEALAAGCGVVSSRVSGVEDYEKDPLAQDCLRLYDIGNIEEAIDRILEVKAIQGTIREQAARKLAAQEFSIESCVTKYADVLQTAKVVAKPLPAQKAFSTILKSRILAILRFVKYRATH